MKESACLLTFVVLVMHVPMTSPFQGRIPIGAIFDDVDDDKAAKTGFLFGISRFNNNISAPFKLSALVDVGDVGDSFTLASSICSHMATGVFMLFGTRKVKSSSIIQAYTQRFHVPYVSPSLADLVPRPGPSYQINMRPSHIKALADVIRHFGWRTFHYVYDAEEGLYSLQEILRLLDGYRYAVQVKMRRLYDVDSAHEDLRSLDKVEGTTRNATYKFILLDLSTESAYYKLMKQIREVGMNKQGYHYLLGTLDFLNLDMARYQHGGVNITGFQLVNYSSPFVQDFLAIWRTLDPNIWPGAADNTIHIDTALSVDAIEMIQRTLTRMIQNSPRIFQNTFRRGQVYNYNRTKGVPCNASPPVSWMHGERLLREMKKLQFEGVTGKLKFDANGFRKDYKLDVYNVGLNNGPDKIGDWSPTGGVHSVGYSTEPTNDTDKEKVYIVTSIKDDPFLMLKDGTNKDGTPFVGNDRYEGYCVELAARIADYMKFDYVIKLVKDNAYGKPLNGTDWNGMVGELLRHEADLAIAPLSITSERERVVDFSKPFMNVGISIMIKKPEKKKPGVFSFLQPFTLDLWMCIVVGYILVGVGIFIVSRFSPTEWRRSQLNTNVRYNNFTLANSLWFAMGAAMLQGSDETCPRSASGRIIGGAWWFVVLISISSYTANLAAFLTIEKMMTPVSSADDLVSQNDIAYGTLDSGSTQSFFRKSKVPTYKSMWYYMKDTEPQVFAKNISEGIKRVRVSKGKYAFLLESVYNEYANNQYPCDTMKVGPNLNSNHYGIMTRKHDSRKWHDITFAVLNMKEDGTLQKMKKTWWVEKGKCGFDTGYKESKKKSLSLSNVAGIYFILIAGLVLSIIIGVLEFIYTKSKPEMDDGYMLPSETTAATLTDTMSHKDENGPTVPPSPTPQSPNGNIKDNHFSYSFGPPAYTPPKIEFEMDANTSV